MPIETDADRLLFLAPDDFGARAVYTPAGGAPGPTISGIFDRAFAEVGTWTASAAADGIGFGSTSPMFVCRSADLPDGAADGDSIAIALADGTPLGTFDVRVVEPDGTGMTRLQLEIA